MTIPPQVSLGKLEQPKHVFYGRLNSGEADKVREIVDHVGEYLESTGPSKFLIAGVGGILRFPDPRSANDIDLAVSGFKYTRLHHTISDHCFEDVTRFTALVQEYFERLGMKMAADYGGLRERNFSHGSGPFSRMNRRYTAEGNENSAALESELESFGWFKSKGLQIRLQGIRPIDVQFVFNQTTQEWKDEQSRLTEQPTKSGRTTSEQFPYAILLEK